LRCKLLVILRRLILLIILLIIWVIIIIHGHFLSLFILRNWIIIFFILTWHKIWIPHIFHSVILLISYVTRTIRKIISIENRLLCWLTKSITNWLCWLVIIIFLTLKNLWLILFLWIKLLTFLLIYIESIFLESHTIILFIMLLLFENFGYVHMNITENLFDVFSYKITSAFK
jgi:hypothetical protein